MVPVFSCKYLRLNNMDKSERKTSKTLGYRASHRDIASAFQLYQNCHKAGRDEEAVHHLAQCESILSDASTRLTIERVRLIDFRRFRHLEIDFHPRLTTIIGENGAGKTTIAEAIAKTLSWITSNIEKEGNAGKRIVQTDIHVSSQQYAEVGSDFRLTKQNRYGIALSKAISGAEDKKDSFLGEIRALADLYRSVNAVHQINLPVFAYFSVDRSRIFPTYAREISDGVVRSSRLEAYANCLDGGSNFESFLEWFSELDNRAALPPPVSLIDIRRFEALESELRAIAASGKFIPLKRVSDELEAARRLILGPGLDAMAAKHIEMIKKAIVGVIPDATRLFLDRSSGKAVLKLAINNSQIDVAQLSHGQKSVIAMVADIARRLIMLNPKRENPFDGHGIVIIDEIELHLHPRWQQNVLVDLQTMFPQIQFIVTTHSPQILSTVDKGSIRRIAIDEFGNSTVAPVQFQTRGVASTDILEQIMETVSIPDLPETHWLDQYYRYLEGGKASSENARDLFAKLENHFGVGHPVIVKLRSDVEFHRLKTEISLTVPSKTD